MSHSYPPVKGTVPSDYFVEVALGSVHGSSFINLAGRNPAVSASFADIWGGGALSTLAYDGQTGEFTAGLVITGATSAATASIVVVDDSGTSGTLTVRNGAGEFVDGEVISDTSTGSADAAGTRESLGIKIDPTGGEQLEIVCESADDDELGVGARSIVLLYTDENLVPDKLEVVDLDGHNGVLTTATDILCIQAAFTFDFGSATNPLVGKSNTGAIVIRDNATQQLRSIIDFDDTDPTNPHGLNVSQDSHFIVPAGKTAFIVNSVLNTSKNHEADTRIMINEPSTEGYISGGQVSLYQSTMVRDSTTSLIPITAGTKIKFICRSNNTAVDVNVTYGILLVED